MLECLKGSGDVADQVLGLLPMLGYLTGAYRKAAPPQPLGSGREGGGGVLRFSGIRRG